MTAVTGEDDVEDHSFLGGHLTLRQMRRGHRAGTDACLLAAAVSAGAGACIVDAGAGVGTAGMIAMRREPGATAILVERDPIACKLATHNLASNGMADRARVVEADLFDRAMLARMDMLGCADVVISNPPFYDADRTRASPDVSRREAHVLRGGSQADWLRAITSLGKPRSRLVLIHRADALPTLMQGWPAGWGNVRLRPVQPRSHQPATRILIAATQGSRAPFALLPPFVLHDDAGRFTAAADALHRGLLDQPLL